MYNYSQIKPGFVFKEFVKYYKPYKSIFFADAICAVILTGIDVAFPQILRFFTSNFFYRPAGEILASLGYIFIGLFVLYVIRTLCQFYITRWGHYMGTYMEADMRHDLFYKYQHLSFSYFDLNSSGDMLSRIVNDLHDIGELAHHGPENLLIFTLKVVGSFILMFMMNVPLSIIMLITTVIMTSYSIYINYKKRVVFRNDRERTSDINTQIQESLGGIKTVKSFGNENSEIKKFKKINKKFVDVKKQSYKFISQFNAANSMFTGVLYTVTIVFGGYLVAYGMMQINELAIFAIYIGIFVNPIELLINFTETFQQGYAGFRRFVEIMQTKPDVVDKDGAIDFPKKSKTDIKFENVSFNYKKSKRLLTSRHHTIENLNLEIEDGQKIALFGPSGEGKSTICSLLCRFYDIDEGSIKINDHDIRDIKLSSLRELIGAVSQDIFIFNGTIRDNISYAKRDAEIGDIIIAAKSAYIHDFIMTLPYGYDTKVGERGTMLSGGQKQRIAIARLFLRNPRIILLDEATSALDNKTEAQIQESLSRLTKNKTTITIAHRLSTIKNVDKIAIVNQGRIVEFGTHDELIKNEGIYKKFYDLQFSV